jgi:Fe-S cluster biogenesis protein NfuA
MAEAAEERVHRIEQLVEQVDAIPDPKSRASAHALMEAILELHGAGLDRMVEIVLDSGESGKAALRRFAGDDLIASLLVLHDLHPDDIETRVHRALAKMSGNAELVGVFEGVVRIRLTSSHCGLKETVEAALREAVPDAAEIVVEEALPTAGFVPIESLGSSLVSVG